MVKTNLRHKEIAVKIVYYGPGFGGKTTSLQQVYEHTPTVQKGEMTSIQTEGDRTLFFDFVPLEVSGFGGVKTKLQLYTVPGQVYFNATRKLVLKGVDGIVFVADSSPDKLEENIESFQNLAENLADQGQDLADFPHVIQFNKRDLRDALDVGQLDDVINPYRVPTFETTATTGEGVIPALSAITGMVIESVSTPIRQQNWRRQASKAQGEPAAVTEKARKKPAAAVKKAKKARKKSTRQPRTG